MSANRIEGRRRDAGRRQGLIDAEIRTDPLMDSAAVRRHVGDISEMTLYRWSKTNGFPPPDLRVNRNKYWRLSTVDTWIDTCAAQQPAS